MNVRTTTVALFLWMHSLTSVKSQDCTLEQFLTSRLYDGNFDTTNLQATYNSGKQVRVGCSVGYSGFFRLICSEGRWESRGSKCEPKQCGHPGDSPFADFHLDKGIDFVFGSRVVYTCHKGYQMQSRIPYRNCVDEGWDGNLPICEARECPSIAVDDSVQVNGDPFEATYGNVVRFSCKSSREILIGSKELYCDDNGQWSGEAPTCKEIKCSVPVIENGLVVGEDRDYDEHEVLHFTCNRKYTRPENRPSKCTKVGERAEWRPTPACELTKCRVTLPPLEGTRYEPAFRNVFLPGDTLRVFCEEKFWIFSHEETSRETTCNDQGEWSIRPVCQEVTCRNQRERNVYWWSVYWGQQIRLGDTATYSCQSNYRSTDGSNLARCTRRGWMPNPLCQEITCERFDIPNAENTDHYKKEYRIYETARYTCKEGYEGNPTRVCRENGWTGVSQCTATTCNRQDYTNAEITGEFKSEYRYNEVVEYTCKNGYEGRFSQTCKTEGWVKTSQCRKQLCKKPEIENADVGHDGKASYSQNERVQYVCRNSGITYTATCEQGVWTGIQTCTEQLCKKPEIENADVGHDGKASYSQNERVQYVCRNSGITYTATCEQGVWTGIQTCTEQLCKKPEIENADVGHDGKASYSQNERVQYVCRNSGITYTATCEQGVWTGIQTCTVAGCEKPEVVNGFAVGPFEGKVYYTCNKSYKLFSRGDWGEATCNADLQWSGLGRCIENKQCGAIPRIPNGNVTPPSAASEQGQRLRIVCQEGFEAHAESLTCVRGIWKPQVTLGSICRPLTTNCKAPVRFENAVVVAPPQKLYLTGSEVQYQCREKFTMEGEGKRRCNNGNWENNIRCTPNCDKLEDHNLTFSADTDQSKDSYKNGESIEYQCVTPGAEPGGVATCIKGKWEKTVECAAPSQLQGDGV